MICLNRLQISSMTNGAKPREISLQRLSFGSDIIVRMWSIQMIVMPLSEIFLQFLKPALTLSPSTHLRYHQAGWKRIDTLTLPAHSNIPYLYTRYSIAKSKHTSIRLFSYFQNALSFHRTAMGESMSDVILCDEPTATRAAMGLPELLNIGVPMALVPISCSSLSMEMPCRSMSWNCFWTRAGSMMVLRSKAGQASIQNPISEPGWWKGEKGKTNLRPSFNKGLLFRLR